MEFVAIVILSIYINIGKRNENKWNDFHLNSIIMHKYCAFAFGFVHLTEWSSGRASTSTQHIGELCAYEWAKWPGQSVCDDEVLKINLWIVSIIWYRCRLSGAWFSALFYFRCCCRLLLLKWILLTTIKTFGRNGSSATQSLSHTHANTKHPTHVVFIVVVDGSRHINLYIKIWTWLNVIALDDAEPFARTRSHSYIRTSAWPSI